MSIVSLFFGSVTLYGWILLGMVYISGLILIHLNEGLVRDLREMDGILGIIFGAMVVIFWPVSFITIFVVGFILECIRAGFDVIKICLGRFRKLTGD